MVPQHQVQIVSPQILSIIPNPLPIVTPPPVQLPILQPIVLNAVPAFTTNEIQLKAISSSPTYTEPPQSIPSLSSLEHVPPPIRPVSPPAAPIASIQPPLPMAPQNIPPPSPIQVQNIPPPPLPPKKSEDSPKIHIGNISMPVKKTKSKEAETANNLEVGEIPTPPLKKGNESGLQESRKQKRRKRKTKDVSVSGCSPPPPGYFDAIPLPESTPDGEESRGKSNVLLLLPLAHILCTAGGKLEFRPLWELTKWF